MTTWMTVSIHSIDPHSLEVVPGWWPNLSAPLFGLGPSFCPEEQRAGIAWPNAFDRIARRILFRCPRHRFMQAFNSVLTWRRLKSGNGSFNTEILRLKEDS